MNSLGKSLTVLGTAIGLMACAEPVKENAAAPKPAAAPAKSAYRKPVRMNGRGKIEAISLEEFYALKESGKAAVYDARPALFYSLGHIAGARSLPLHGSDERIHEQEAEIKAALAAGKSIVVYCTSTTCPDARSLAIHFSGFGYPVKIFSGGWDAWKEAGMPTE